MAQRRNVLITGAGGFTGRHLFAYLSSDSVVELFLADRAAPQVSDSRFRVCNFFDAAAVTVLIGAIRPDEVYHLVGSYTNQYDVDYESNVISTKNILDAIRAAKLMTRVLLIGSSAEYGFPLYTDEAVSEEHPLRPVSIYGLVKRFQTELMDTYIRLYGMDIVAVRPFNLLGKSMSPILFVGKMEQEIERYKHGESKEIVTGDLSIERDYIDIDEAIQYYRLVMEKGKTGEVYNVGSGESVSLREILRSMLSGAGLGMEMVREAQHETPGKIVVPKIFADVSKIKQLAV